MERSKILIIEDCELSRETLSEALRSQYDVETVGDAEGAFVCLEQKRYDLLILDLGLPGMDGHKFCARLRETETIANTPIIIHSGRCEIEEKMLGFSLGAKDFIIKPVDLRELRARIQVHLGQKKIEAQAARVLQVGPFECNFVNQTVSYWAQGNKMDIVGSQLEFKLLHFFLTHIEHVVSRDQLLDQVWGDARHVSDRSVDAFVCKLRRKLGPYAVLLQSVYRVGYRFCDPQGHSNQRYKPSQDSVKKVA